MIGAPEVRTRSYLEFAFGGLVVAVYLYFAFVGELRMPEWRLYLCFAAGAAYALIGSFGHRFKNDTEAAGAGLIALQCLLATTAVFASPREVRGMFGILTLPVVSQSVFTRSRLGASLVVAAMFAVTALSIGLPFGWEAGLKAMLGYAPAFVFTVAFSLVGRKALAARAEAQMLSGELSQANARLRERAAQAEELATARERNRLAREIHDGVGHYLTVIKVQLDAAAATLGSQPETARRSVETAARLAAEALEDVRRSVGALRGDGTRLPVAEVLRQLAAHGQPVPAISVVGEPRVLEPALEHALFRAAQEGLTNIRKHAQATSATVTLDFRAPARVRLEVADDGLGLAKGGALGGTAGFGLAGLRERVESLGGVLATAERSGGGCVLTVEVPG